jgi:hypothetical protein
MGIMRADASSHEGMPAMLRPLWILAALAIATTFSAGGCRSCSNCHDYDPPVAACDCHACGTERAGSGGGGYASHADTAGPHMELDNSAEPQALEPDPAEGVEP